MKNKEWAQTGQTTNTAPTVDPWQVSLNKTAAGDTADYTAADLEKMKEKNDEGWTRCIFYTRPAGCKTGADCRFWHDECSKGEKAALEVLNAERRAKQTGSGGQMGVCWAWQTSGTCKFGNKCRFEHVEHVGGSPAGKK